MRDDLKAAFRALRSSKTFTAVALGVLTLGIGATTAIFSVVDAVVIRGLPFDEHDRLVAMGQRTVPKPGAPVNPAIDPQSIGSLAPQNYLDVAAQQQVFEAIAAVAGGAATLREPGGEPEEIRTQRVTAGFFAVLREQPVIGRAFTTEHEVDGRHRVAVISAGLWRRRFGADPGIVGRRIPLDAGAFEVVGVMGPEFQYPVSIARPTEMWIPYVPSPEERVRNKQSYSIYLQSIARLKPGVSFSQAQANLDQITGSLTSQYPDYPHNKDTLFAIRPLHDHIVGARTAQWMWMLLGAVGIVLVIACANVANLLLARATSREREVGIRAAMGAGRWHLLRQLMVESLVLSAIGTVLAILVAWWGVGVIKSAIPDGVPRISSITLDLRVLLAAAALSLGTGLLFGIVPAVQLSRPDLTQALKEGARGASAGHAGRRLRSALVVIEVALAVVLLVGAALFIGSFRVLMRIDPGFKPDHVLTASVQPRVDFSGGAQPPSLSPQFLEIVDRISRVPAVTAASVVSGGMPMGGSTSMSSFTVPGRTDLTAGKSVKNVRVTPEFHRALGIPLIRGRLFEPTDRESTPKVMIINESAAKQFFPGEDPIGRTAGLNGDRTIVGIVGDVYQRNLEAAPVAEAYLPVAQSTIFSGEVIVRTSGDPNLAVPGVRAAVLAVLPDVPLRSVRTMEDIIGRQIAQRRFNMMMLGLFGLLGLVISAVGIYGVMAYVVSQREREIGVRMALGATRGSVVTMVLRSALVLVLAGLVIGGVAAWYLSGAAKTFLFRMDVNDPRAFITAIAALVAAAIAASVIPARRAASVDPIVTLRSE